MAGEFGISNDEVLTLLRQMDVPVRSHLSQLTDDQVARVRARWEREKRARAEKPAPAARRRRGAGAPEPATAAAPAKAGRATAAPAEPVAASAPAATASAPASAGPGDVRRRRRPAADVAAAAAAAAAAAPPEPAPVEAEAPEVIAAPSAPPEAPRVQVDAEPEMPPAPVEIERATYNSDRPLDRQQPRAEPSSPAGAAGQSARPSMPSPASAMPSVPSLPDSQRPRPIVPGAPRPRGGSPTFQPPRPVASAQPGFGSAPPRRDDKRGGMGAGGGGGGGGGGGAGAGAGSALGGARRRKGKRGNVDQEAVTANISKTMTALRGPGARRGGRRPFEDGVSREEMEAQRVAEVEREKKTVRVNEFITVSELADILKVPATQIVSFAFKNLGLMVTINQRMDFDQIELIASEFGFQAVREEEYAASTVEEEVEKDEDLQPRPPIVTIMGHVDHGKTSLLDYIRKASVVAGEAGGITQHIGAYHVTLPSGKEITFLDTPGHEAFTAMRARGAQVTDIVVLVVAADDQVMPQTIEAISHAKNAGVPLIVAINKIDLPAANPMKVRQDLLQHGVVLEEFGGQTLATEISARKGTNVDQLLEQILLQAEVLDLKANPNRRATGSVVEAQLDPGKGPVATVLVQQGQLRVGDDFICGMFSGRVRALLDERGKPVKVAGPAIPVQVLGMAGVPTAGDQFIVVEDATESREIAQRRQRLHREAHSRRTAKGSVSLEDFMSQSAAGQKRTLRIVIKADQGGPAEALADALAQLSNEEVSVEVIHRGVGAVTETDILLARAAGAIIIGFHVRPDNNARAAAEREGVDIKLYRIIYEAVSDVRSALEGLLRPEEREVRFGEAEVRETFKVPKIGVIAGCIVRSGVINRQGRVRLIRDGVQVYDGTIGSLRRFKDDVREVREGFECGIGIENFNDVKVGDIIEAYRTEEVARTLKPTEAADR